MGSFGAAKCKSTVDDIHNERYGWLNPHIHFEAAGKKILLLYTRTGIVFQQELLFLGSLDTASIVPVYGGWLGSTRQRHGESTIPVSVKTSRTLPWHYSPSKI